MPFAPGTEVIPGWRVRFAIKAAADADTYRVVASDGALGFLKVFRLECVGADRFDANDRLLEIVIAESIRHEGVPRARESGVLEGSDWPYLLMELIPGETLGDLLAREVALPHLRARDLMSHLVKAAAHLHRLQDPVFHNELTPANVLLDIRTERTGRPMIIDFGHARRRSDGPARPASTLNAYYLPNECLDEAVSSPATDVFSLGAVWFRTLFGLPPWDLGMSESRARVTDIREALLEQRAGPPPFPKRPLFGDAPKRVLTVLERALAVRPEDRFEDAAALLAALDEDGAPRAVLRLTARKASASAEPAPSRPLPMTAVPTQRGFDRIAGMAKLKQTLIEDFANPLRDPEKYRRFGLGIPNGILLYGPPGCGKTFFAECLGEEVGFAFRTIRPSDVGSTYIHGTQRLVAQLFDAARKQAPSILFLDEADALTPSRERDDTHAHLAAEVNEWLAQISGCGEDGVFVIAATNRPERMDPAFVRTGRLDKVAYVGPPDLAARKAMFELYLRERPTLGALDCGELAGQTKGWVSSDIRFLVDEGARLALGRGAEGISAADMVEAIRRNRPSVSSSQLAQYERNRTLFERTASTPKRPIGFSGT